MRQRKLGRRSSGRKALFRSMVTALLRHGRIMTTESKAKTIKGLAEEMITLGKRGDLHARRQAESFLLDAEVTKKLFSEIAPKYAERQGGYTRVLKVGVRRGDGAPTALLELV